MLLATDMTLWSGWIQLGFAGFCLVLMTIVIILIGLDKWMFGKLLEVQKTSNGVNQQLAEVIASNTKAIENLTRLTEESRQLHIQIKDELLKRPCLFKTED